MTETRFDLSEAADSLAGLETQLADLGERAGPRAAEAMAEAFEAAANRMEAAFGRVARTGELDFESMVNTILADLARIAVNGLLDQVLPQTSSSGPSTPAQSAVPVTVNITMPQGQTGQGLIASEGAIAASLARAVSSGVRWS